MGLHLDRSLPLLRCGCGVAADADGAHRAYPLHLPDRDGGGGVSLDGFKVMTTGDGDLYVRHIPCHWEHWETDQSFTLAYLLRLCIRHDCAVKT